MRRVNLLLADNTLGSDPINHFYKAVTSAYPELGLNRTNSRISYIKPAATIEEPNLTRLLITKDGDINQIYEFFYNRFDIKDFVKNPIFNPAELTTALGINNSKDLCEFVGQVVKQNFIGHEFWTDIATIDYTGGDKKPNWYMKAIFDSVYWMGDVVVWLHQGT